TGDFSKCQVKPQADELDNFHTVSYEKKHKRTEAPKLQMTTSSAPAAAPYSDTKALIKEAEQNGEKLYGSTCPNCSSTRMVMNGTCKVCLDCGTTTGCS
ncbi:MAG: hypothetical protein QMB63_04735, partial [Clostridiaceae bacterium]